MEFSPGLMQWWLVLQIYVLYLNTNTGARKADHDNVKIALLLQTHAVMLGAIFQSLSNFNQNIKYVEIQFMELPGL